MQVSEAIRRARGTRRREQFAVDCGCSYTTVIRWEQGSTIPTDYEHIAALIREGVPESLLVNP